MRVRRALTSLLVPALLVSSAGPVAAQGLVPGLLGGAAGFVGGGYVSVGIWTAKARFDDDFLYSADDALALESAPVVLGTVTGAVLGVSDRDRLERTVVGGAVGFAVGTGIGVLLGESAWDPPEGRWAGGVIGGSAGLLVGSLVGLAWSDGDEDGTGGADPAGEPAGIPVALTIRF